MYTHTHARTFVAGTKAAIIMGVILVLLVMTLSTTALFLLVYFRIMKGRDKPTTEPNADRPQNEGVAAEQMKTRDGFNNSTISNNGTSFESRKEKASSVVIHGITN